MTKQIGREDCPLKCPEFQLSFPWTNPGLLEHGLKSVCLELRQNSHKVKSLSQLATKIYSPHSKKLQK